MKTRLSTLVLPGSALSALTAIVVCYGPYVFAREDNNHQVLLGVRSRLDLNKVATILKLGSAHSEEKHVLIYLPGLWAPPDLQPDFKKLPSGVSVLRFNYLNLTSVDTEDSSPGTGKKDSNSSDQPESTGSLSKLDSSSANSDVWQEKLDGLIADLHAKGFKVHLQGHSTGALLALRSLLKSPSKLTSVSSINGAFSLKPWNAAIVCLPGVDWLIPRKLVSYELEGGQLRDGCEVEKLSKKFHKEMRQKYGHEHPSFNFRELGRDFSTKLFVFSSSSDWAVESGWNKELARHLNTPSFVDVKLNVSADKNHAGAVRHPNLLFLTCLQLGFQSEVCERDFRLNFEYVNRDGQLVENMDFRFMALQDLKADLKKYGIDESKADVILGYFEKLDEASLTIGRMPDKINEEIAKIYVPTKKVKDLYDEFVTYKRDAEHLELAYPTSFENCTASQSPNALAAEHGVKWMPTSRHWQRSSTLELPVNDRLRSLRILLDDENERFIDVDLFLRSFNPRDYCIEKVKEAEQKAGRDCAAKANDKKAVTVENCLSYITKAKKIYKDYRDSFQKDYERIRSLILSDLEMVEVLKSQLALSWEKLLPTRQKIAEKKQELFIKTAVGGKANQPKNVLIPAESRVKTSSATD